MCDFGDDATLNTLEVLRQDFYQQNPDRPVRLSLAMFVQDRLDELAWMPLLVALPKPGSDVLLKTRNNKFMVLSHESVLDRWFVDKYGITHWKYIV